ncbi:fibrinolytic enzyme, isozyme C-like [Haliotis cracherodii]|uniref:fibrinolytic enzyme, isozyme C-like n=1 Tax=Haliotis rufescens TaxID=6454 RepID=UPI001EAF9629|nr:fibrinolytic enzyme, isozyme C-like [Haliotis rufescens]
MKLCLLLAISVAYAAAAPAERIVGGSEATPHTWPWQLSLRRQGSHICGAAILTANYAVTAAHCVDGQVESDMSIVAGGHSLQNPSMFEQAIDVTYVMHPSYNGDALGFPNDIAILRLATPLEFNDGVQPANLVPDDSKDFAGEKDCFITGWGKLGGSESGVPDLLQEVQTDVVTNSACRSALGLFPGLGLSSSHVCVYDSANQASGACNGDSGGPLVCMSNGQYTLIGVTSWGLSGCATDAPSVYTRVSKFLDWVKSNSDL